MADPCTKSEVSIALAVATCIRRPRRGWPPSNFAEILGIRKLESLGYRVVLFVCDPTFCRFSRTPACDTDRHRQTDTGPWLVYRGCIASRGKKIILNIRSPLKIRTSVQYKFRHRRAAVWVHNVSWQAQAVRPACGRRSLDLYLLPARRSSSKPAAAACEWWDGRTDRQTLSGQFHRPRAPHTMWAVSTNQLGLWNIENENVIIEINWKHCCYTINHPVA